MSGRQLAENGKASDHCDQQNLCKMIINCDIAVYIIKSLQMSEDTSNPVYKLITNNLQQALINVLIRSILNVKVLQGSVATR